MRWGRRSLRFRVLAGLVGIMVVAFAAIGLVTVIALNRFLLGRLDQQLTTANGRYVASATESAERDGHRSDGDGDADDGFGDARAQSADTLGVRVNAGQIVSFGIVGQSPGPSLPASDRSKLLTVAAGHNESRDLGPLGDYRLRASTLADGDRVIIGLPLRPVHETLAELLTVELVAFGAVLVGTIAASGWLISISFRPLTRVTATARQVSESELTDDDLQLSQRVPTPEPGTEVGQLAIAFNHMLDHVETSLLTRRDTEDRLRQFIADASHELRTPVASIRGHAESVRYQQLPVPDEVLESLQRIESEAHRMGVLVDDLLLLARLDAGRPLAREPVDLSRIAIDTTSDARAAGRDHEWSLDLPEEPVMVVGDDYRLREAVTNLLTNARTHTPSGTAVLVSISVADGNAVLSVGDNGPGMPPDVQSRVFERFYRGQPGRAPTTGSSGLGLAIVDAVAKAHGGAVTVSSDSGHTQFTLTCPLSLTDELVLRRPGG